MSNTTSATQAAAQVVIARPNSTGDRPILRNGVLVGHCYQATASWCGPGGRRDRWWVVTNVFGHCLRESTPTLADVRAAFA